MRGSQLNTGKCFTLRNRTQKCTVKAHNCEFLVESDFKKDLGSKHMRKTGEAGKTSSLFSVPTFCDLNCNFFSTSLVSYGKAIISKMSFFLVVSCCELIPS